MKSMAQNRSWRVLTAFGGLLLVLTLVFVACGGSNQSISTPTPKPGTRPGTTLYTYRGHAGGVMVLAWSPDGTYIASASSERSADRNVQVWDAMTGKLRLTYRGHSANVIGLVWSPDSKYIASAGNDATAQVWDAMTGKLRLTYRADAGGSPVGLAWSPDGTYIVASEFRPSTPEMNKCDVQVFDAMTGKLLLTYRGHSSLVWSLAWSPDGKYIASASEDGTVQVWQAP
jgi:eukaryotic-like serine/threonine-protein kinase